MIDPATTARNEIFIENRRLIGFVIRRNMPLIRALRLDIEDVSQDLAIGALKAIESFDSSRGMKIESFISYKLQFEILSIRKKLNCDCRSANTSSISLDCSFYDDENEEKTTDIPMTIDYDSEIAIREVMDMLSEKEKEVVHMKLAGGSLTDERQRLYMDRVRKKVIRYYLRDKKDLRSGVRAK